MPLSEEEQRVLDEIERQFYASDPTLARTVQRSAPKTVTGRRVGKGVVAIVAGIVVLLIGFTTSPLLGFCGFLLMLGGALSLHAALRSGGGLSALRERLVPNNLRDAIIERRKPRDPSDPS